LLAAWVLADWWRGIPEGQAASFVGRTSCVRCHEEQARLFTGSHHDLAMDPATPQTVLADFNDSTFSHFGVESRFFKKGDEFWVATEGSQGTIEEFKISYTFGVDPLQQYLVERPDGRMQCLSIAWDVAGKNWFHLYPNERILPDDPLFWLNREQNWNHMCADCHSTNLKRGYEARTDTFHTTWSEIDVSCEACHGPGSHHVQLAEAWSLFWDRQKGKGLTPLKGPANQPEVNVCAACHSRRGFIAEGFGPGEEFLDHFHPSLLDESLYYTDGQIQDEVYEYGSFLQSKMFHQGVRCSDCHDPHSARIKLDGNKLCTSCHQNKHPAPKYDTPAHHHHREGSTGASCVACHMPQRTYMVVDPRHDHSFRIPRPDLTVALGTPNACAACHSDKPAEWARDRVVEWYGPKRPDDPHYAKAFAAGRRGLPGADRELAELARKTDRSGMIRGTAVSLLAAYATPESRSALEAALSDRDPLVRMTAAGAYDGAVDPDSDFNAQGQISANLARMLGPLLYDPARAVRIEAGRVLAQARRDVLTSSDQEALDRAVGEYVAAQELIGYRPESHVNLGLLHTSRGDLRSAEREYLAAIEIDGLFAAPRLNLAGLYDDLGRKDEALHMLATGTDLLARDIRLLPENAVLRYRYGLACYRLDRLDEAETSLAEAVRLEPDSVDFQLAYVRLLEFRKNWPAALNAARRLVEMRPDETGFHEVLQSIQAESQAIPFGPQRP
jgi:predicted CXXCH cytochrome family protein